MCERSGSHIAAITSRFSRQRSSRNQPTSVPHVRHRATKLMLLQLLEQNVHLRTFHFPFPCTCSASYFGLRSAAASVDMNIVAESDSGQPAGICALSQDIPTPHLIPFNSVRLDEVRYFFFFKNERNREITLELTLFHQLCSLAVICLCVNTEAETDIPISFGRDEWASFVTNVSFLSTSKK